MHVVRARRLCLPIFCHGELTRSLTVGLPPIMGKRAKWGQSMRGVPAPAPPPSMPRLTISPPACHHGPGSRHTRNAQCVPHRGETKTNDVEHTPEEEDQLPRSGLFIRNGLAPLQYTPSSAPRAMRPHNAAAVQCERLRASVQRTTSADGVAVLGGCCSDLAREKKGEVLKTLFNHLHADGVVAATQRPPCALVNAAHAAACKEA